MTSIVNLRFQKYDVYIGRAGKGQDGYFGNPFSVETSNRKECLKQYENYFHKRLKDDSVFCERVEQLRDKTLGCFCKPKSGFTSLFCHGQIIAGYLDGIEPKLVKG